MRVSYADYVATVPPPLQILISMLLTAGITVALVWACHGPILKLAQEPKQEEDNPRPKVPASYFLSGRIIQITGIVFVFLFTFTVAQFVVNGRNADSGSQYEVQYFSRAMAAAENLPSDAGRDEVVAALDNYKTTVVDIEWPLMQRADAEGAYTAQQEASTAISDALATAKAAGAVDSLAWDPLMSGVEDMLINATDRLSNVPSSTVTSLVTAVIFLGAVSLALTAVFLPARLGINLVLIGILGATYGFMFYLVAELANPFDGRGGLISMFEWMQ